MYGCRNELVSIILMTVIDEKIFGSMWLKGHLYTYIYILTAIDDINKKSSLNQYEM
jgi:hypothetical protein